MREVSIPAEVRLRCPEVRGRSEGGCPEPSRRAQNTQKRFLHGKPEAADGMDGAWLSEPTGLDSSVS